MCNDARPELIVLGEDMRINPKVSIPPRRSERPVNDVRRGTRTHYPAENKIRIVRADFATMLALPNSTTMRTSSRLHANM